MQLPIFSIIVPIYKVEQYLERCIDSLINQTEKNIEIILIDDGSPDCCPVLCDHYAERYKNIIVVHKTNGGLSDARNEGIQRANGEYVMFVDSDDYIDLEACERLLCFAKNGVDVIVTDGISEGKVVNLTHSGISNNKIYTGKNFLKESMIYGSIPMAAWLYVYRRDFLEANDLTFKRGIYHEDEEFTPRALLLAESVVYSAMSFYHYVIRENSITQRSDKRKNAKDLYETCKHLSLIYDNLDDEELRLYLKDSLVNKYLSLFQEGRLYQYGDEYLHKKFVVNNAYRKRNKLKAWLYDKSPMLYWYINKLVGVL